jgi:amidase
MASTLIRASKQNRPVGSCRRPLRREQAVIVTTRLSSTDVETIAVLDATAQAALVRDREVAPGDLVEVAIQRIEALNPTLNAVVTPAFELARDAVAARLPDGPFTGVPFLLKDLAVEAAGLRFCEGSRFLRDNVSTVDSEIVVRLRRAGLVILGKTNTCEFGMRPTVEPALFGPTANPWDVSRTTGGSSGGSAAAVASGMVPMAHANDAGGSIRIPASACGLFGLKPSRARNTLGPLYGDAFLGWACEQAVTRSVRDSAALLDATAGPLRGDPYAVPPPERPYVDEAGRPPGRLRVAWTGRPSSGSGVVDPECLAALDATVTLLEDLGHEVVERDLVELDERVGAAIGTMYGAATVWVVRYWTRLLGRPPEPDELEPFTWALHEHGQRVSAGDLLLAVTDLQAFSRQVAAVLADEADVWVSPTLGTLPLPLGVMGVDAADPWKGNAESADMVSFPLVVANLTGNPAMSVPLHWTGDGLPVGVNVMGPFGREDMLFRLAAQLEEARPWRGRRPPVW